MKTKICLIGILALAVINRTDSFAQLKVWNNTAQSVMGQVVIGDMSNPWDAYLYVKNTTANKRCLFLKHYATITSGQHSSGVQVDQSGTASWVVFDYQGTAKFWVMGNGDAYTRSVLLSSDSTLKENISRMKSVKEGLFSINGYKYDFKEDKLKGGKKNIGFLAQEVEKVFPEVVDTANGKMFIAYYSIIPIVVEAMKEQQAEIDELKSGMQLLSKKVQDLEKGLEKSGQQSNSSLEPGQSNHSEDLMYEDAVLYQNSPNPFFETTTIRVFLPSTVSSASLSIFDGRGVERKKIILKERGNIETLINARALNAGTYSYSLVVDNKFIASKTMILTTN